MQNNSSMDNFYLNATQKTNSLAVQLGGDFCFLAR